MVFVVIGNKLSQKLKDKIKAYVPSRMLVDFNEHISFLNMVEPEVKSAAKALELLELSPEESEEFIIIEPRDWAGHGEKEFRDRMADWGAAAAEKGKEKNRGGGDANQQGSD